MYIIPLCCPTTLRDAGNGLYPDGIGSDVFLRLLGSSNCNIKNIIHECV